MKRKPDIIPIPAPKGSERWIKQRRWRRLTMLQRCLLLSLLLHLLLMFIFGLIAVTQKVEKLLNNREMVIEFDTSTPEAAAILERLRNPQNEMPTEDPTRQHDPAQRTQTASATPPRATRVNVDRPRTQAPSESRAASPSASRSADQSSAPADAQLTMPPSLQPTVAQREAVRTAESSTVQQPDMARPQSHPSAKQQHASAIRMDHQVTERESTSMSQLPQMTRAAEAAETSQPAESKTTLNLTNPTPAAQAAEPQSEEQPMVAEAASAQRVSRSTPNAEPTALSSRSEPLQQAEQSMAAAAATSARQATTPAAADSAASSASAASVEVQVAATPGAVASSEAAMQVTAPAVNAARLSTMDHASQFSSRSGAEMATPAAVPGSSALAALTAGARAARGESVALSSDAAEAVSNVQAGAAAGSGRAGIAAAETGTGDLFRAPSGAARQSASSGAGSGARAVQQSLGPAGTGSASGEVSLSGAPGLAGRTPGASAAMSGQAGAAVASIDPGGIAGGSALAAGEGSIEGGMVRGAPGAERSQRPGGSASASARAGSLAMSAGPVSGSGLSSFANAGTFSGPSRNPGTIGFGMPSTSTATSSMSLSIDGLTGGSSRVAAATEGAVAGDGLAKLPSRLASAGGGGAGRGKSLSLDAGLAMDDGSSFASAGPLFRSRGASSTSTGSDSAASTGKPIAAVMPTIAAAQSPAPITAPAESLEMEMDAPMKALARKENRADAPAPVVASVEPVKTAPAAPSAAPPPPPAPITVAATLTPVDVSMPTKQVEPVTESPATLDIQPGRLFDRSDAMRRQLVKTMGGSDESEAAVDKALAWLASVQEPDGRWSFFKDPQRPSRDQLKDKNDMALTGLASLCFLAANHTPGKPGPYQTHITKGIDFLVREQQGDGDLRGDGSMYSHGIANIALAEAAIMTGEARYRDAALAGAKFILDAQNDRTGGWRYKPGMSGDTSVFGWQIMALHSCEYLDFKVPDATRQRAYHWLDSVSSGVHGTLAGYMNSLPRPAMTAEAALARMLLGQQLSDDQQNEACNYMLEEHPSNGDRNYYLWYYCSLAMMQMQNQHWQTWNLRIRDFLIAAQEENGSWNTESRYGHAGGRVYTTAIATLTLEVYYRYLPMYQRRTQKTADAR